MTSHLLLIQGAKMASSPEDLLLIMHGYPQKYKLCPVSYCDNQDRLPLSTGRGSYDGLAKQQVDELPFAHHLARANICPLPHLLRVIHVQWSFNSLTEQKAASRWWLRRNTPLTSWKSISLATSHSSRGEAQPLFGIRGIIVSFVIYSVVTDGWHIILRLVCYVRFCDLRVIVWVVRIVGRKGNKPIYCHQLL